MLIENTVRDVRHLFVLECATGQIRRALAGDDYDSEFTSSLDGRTVAFVRQSPHAPPEIYVARTRQPAGISVRQPVRITAVNQRLATLQLPMVEHMIWSSSDGAALEGWLMLPVGYRPGVAYPLLTFLHGGPTGVLTNQFAPYFPVWPYPFQVFAARGYAIFPARRNFAAASFAEGYGDEFLTYALNPTLAATTLNEFYWGQGTSPYADPARWIRVSAVFHLAGLATPVLLEYGDPRAVSLALDGFAFAAALYRQGVPHEFVVYPNTNHNPHLPSVQLESMIRNLDWFDYWIRGTRDPDPGKQVQYGRWERMARDSKERRATLGSRASGSR